MIFSVDRIGQSSMSYSADNMHKAIDTFENLEKNIDLFTLYCLDFLIMKDVLTDHFYIMTNAILFLTRISIFIRISRLLFIYRFDINGMCTWAGN